MGHFIFYGNELVSERDFLLVSQISLIQAEKSLVSQRKIPVNIIIPGKRFSDVIDLDAFILPFLIRQKKNEVECIPLRCQINNFSFGTFPDTMKFGFDKDLGPFPDGPADVLFSAMCSDMLWDNIETFIDWFSEQDPQWDKNRIVFRNLPAKRENIWF